MSPDQPHALTSDEILAADLLFAELLAERDNTVDLGASALTRTSVAHDHEAPAAAAG